MQIRSISSYRLQSKKLTIHYSTATRANSFFLKTPPFASQIEAHLKKTPFEELALSDPHLISFDEKEYYYLYPDLAAKTVYLFSANQLLDPLYIETLGGPIRSYIKNPTNVTAPALVKNLQELCDTNQKLGSYAPPQIVRPRVETREELLAKIESELKKGGDINILIAKTDRLAESMAMKPFRMFPPRRRTFLQKIGDFFSSLFCFVHKHKHSEEPRHQNKVARVR